MSWQDVMEEYESRYIDQQEPTETESDIPESKSTGLTGKEIYDMALMLSEGYAIMSPMNLDTQRCFLSPEDLVELWRWEKDKYEKNKNLLFQGDPRELVPWDKINAE